MLAQKVIDFFNNYHVAGNHDIDQIYDQAVVFTDPAHKIMGLQDLSDYFESVYKNTEFCRFDVDKIFSEEDREIIVWNMQLIHPQLNQGKLFSVPGCTYLTIEHGKITHHQDYFDLGCLLYENIPVLGRLIKFIKAKLGQ